MPTDQPSPKKDMERDLSPEERQDRAVIKQWQDRITRAKRKWEPDFKRMRANAEFLQGFQWTGQTVLDDERYINNLTLRLVNQKVATLYAKNPTAVAERRDRLDFQIWDGNVESLVDAIQQAAQMSQAGLPLPPTIMDLFLDYQSGKTQQRLIQRVCDTFQRVYQYQVDSQRPDFKEEMKKVVRRTITCGVGYCRLFFCRDDYDYQELSTVDFGSTLQDRVDRIKNLLRKKEEEPTENSDSLFATLRSLVMSVGASQTLSDDFKLPERLEFDFPPATSIIPDERCRSLKEFESCRWLAQEYVLPVDEVNAVFGTSVKVGASGKEGAVEYTPTGLNVQMSTIRDEQKNDPQLAQLVSLYEIYDYASKTRFFICEGWKDYVCPPEPISPSVSGFWHHFALTFNDTEVEFGTRTSPFPPSDVQIVKSPQMEWNRTREALRDHRNANSPKYLVRKGFLTDADKDNLKNAQPNQVVELEGVPIDQPIEKFIVPLQFAPIDPELYDTEPLEQDIMLGGGAQQANIGPAQPNVTATVGTIAEQSRLDVAGSNIDDLDGFLSRIARAGGEMLMQEMSKETVQRIAGKGAVWPDMPASRQDFLNEIFLKIEAASSGRPNKAVNIANLQQLVPLILQAGGNPLGVIEELARALDENIDLSKFFPLVPTQMDQGGTPPQGEEPANPASEPTQEPGFTQPYQVAANS